MDRDGEPVQLDLSEAELDSRTWLGLTPDQSETDVVRIDQLLPAPSPRSAGEDHDHVRLLAEAVTVLPPIVVHRPSMRVVDGMHRLRAAIARGESDIAVRWYDGDERNIFALAVYANVTHGLPLSLADRRSAAVRIMLTNRHWSDRMIAAIVGLSPATVRVIRNGTADHSLASAVRLGQDGRLRPVSSAEGRRLAGELLLANPGSSLREVARSTGLAPSTVLDVRRRLEAGQDPVPGRQRSGGRRRAMKQAHAGGRPVSPTELVDWTAGIRDLRNDPSLRFNEAGRILLRWFNNGPIKPDEQTRGWCGRGWS